jgi:hypothetical protein
MPVTTCLFETTGTRNQRVVEVGAPACSNIFGLGRLCDLSARARAT